MIATALSVYFGALLTSKQKVIMGSLQWFSKSCISNCICSFYSNQGFIFEFDGVTFVDLNILQ